MNKTAVFITYNCVGEPGAYPNGKVERNGNTAIIVQNGEGRKWGVWRAKAKIDSSDEPHNLAGARTEEERQNLLQAETDRQELIAELYNQSFGVSAIPDYFVVYVGAGGSEGAILLSSFAGRERLRFVLCDCNLSGKLELIGGTVGNAPYLICECGGRTTMGRLVESFLETGTVGP